MTETPGAATLRTLEGGRRLFNEGRFFEAHEVWEEAWLRESGQTRQLLQGLIQIAAGYHQACDRGRASGCARLLEAGWERLRPLPEDAGGLALEPFREAVRCDLARARSWGRGESGALARSEAPRLSSKGKISEPAGRDMSPNLPWNCPNPYCKEPHNASSTPIDGVVTCHSCGWERKVAKPEPEAIDELPGLFTPRPPDPEKDPGE